MPAILRQQPKRVLDCPSGDRSMAYAMAYTAQGFHRGSMPRRFLWRPGNECCHLPGSALEQPDCGLTALIGRVSFALPCPQLVLLLLHGRAPPNSSMQKAHFRVTVHGLDSSKEFWKILASLLDRLSKEHHTKVWLLQVQNQIEGGTSGMARRPSSLGNDISFKTVLIHCNV